jgi:ribosome biogenesis GTPase
MANIPEQDPARATSTCSGSDATSHRESSLTSLENLGYEECFSLDKKEYHGDDFTLARVVEVNRSSYKVSNGERETVAELSGKFLFNIESSVDYPTVGDWVVVNNIDDSALAIVHEKLPRKSLLKRKDPGKSVEFQLIAANLDYALIIQSADANFNLNRLERYFVMLGEGEIQPIVILTKIDLISSEELAEISSRIRRFNQKYPILPISNLTGDGMELLHQELVSGKTYCLLGSSGVGKTTLLNGLLGEEQFRVNEVREKDGKGKHTTVSRPLVRLANGSIFIDTPGMRELENFDIEGGLREAFDEIASLNSHCRYSDCTHIHEEGCAVKAAVEQGSIDAERYDNYLKIRKEAAFYEMSEVDKQRKDKSFGKMIKNYKKTMRKK